MKTTTPIVVVKQPIMKTTTLVVVVKQPIMKTTTSSSGKTVYNENHYTSNSGKTIYNENQTWQTWFSNNSIHYSKEHDNSFNMSLITYLSRTIFRMWRVKQKWTVWRVLCLKCVFFPPPVDRGIPRRQRANKATLASWSIFSFFNLKLLIINFI